MRKARRKPGSDCEEDEENEDLKKIKSYFDSVTKRKAKRRRSEHLLSDFDPPAQVKGDQYLIQTHLLERNALIDHHIQRFQRWWGYMQAGFSVLLYGYGSKSLILDLFEKAIFRVISLVPSSSSS